MAIKRVGPGAGIAPTESTTRGSASKAFSTVDGAMRAASSARVQKADPALEAAVASAVERIRAGELPSNEEKVDAVVSELVAQRLEGASPQVVSARAEEARETLADHPGFVASVLALIETGLEEA